ncbi:MFS transporter [Chthonobacter albigriseus]|uniref:MFS transporter n=1 Tax=Chthonobacter albigriseus TaxID=1683161 RepID=UPI0015EF632D
MPHFIRIGAFFFLNAFLIGSWLTRVPDFLADLSIDKATMGLALFAAPIGTVCTIPFVGRWIERSSPARVAFTSVILLSLSLLPIAVAPSWPMLAIAIFLSGAANAGMEVSINSAADASEKARGHKIMSRCHGFWSLGIMAGALVAGALAQEGVSFRVHLPLACAGGSWRAC